METIIIPVICDRCREEGVAGDDPFTAIRDLLAFEPVKRRAHVNNWTAEHQRAYVAALALTGSPRQAARAIGRHAFGADQLKMAKGGRGFADACDAALDLYRERELYRIKEGLSGLVEQAEERDDIARTHLRALPPPFPGSIPAGLLADADAEAEGQEDEYEEAMGSIRRKLLACRRLYLEGISADPAKREAWEVLVGPVDWEWAARGRAQANEPQTSNQREPGMILTAANGGLDELLGRPVDDPPEPEPPVAPGTMRTFGMNSPEFYEAVTEPRDPGRWGPGLPSLPREDRPPVVPGVEWREG